MVGLGQIQEGDRHLRVVHDMAHCKNGKTCIDQRSGMRPAHNRFLLQKAAEVTLASVRGDAEVRLQLI